MNSATTSPTILATGEAFLDALQVRDFNALFKMFGHGMRTRALLPGGPIQVMGAVPTTGLFARWFRDVADFEVHELRAGEIADRLVLQWRLTLRWPGEAFLREIEQTAYAKVDSGLIVVLDLLCTGFRPVDEPTPATRRNPSRS